MTDNPKTLRECTNDLHYLVTNHVKKQEKFQERIDTLLSGDNAQPGLLTRVDRLEQDHKRWHWWIGAIWTGMFSIVIGWFIDRSTP